MPEQYRIGVIGRTGRGNYGHGLDKVWLQLANTQIVGVADDSPEGLANSVERLQAPQGFCDYRLMMDKVKPDIVAICTRWVDQHHEMVLAAAERGMHIYLEKPMCRTPAEADQIIASCKQHHVKLAIAHQSRYSASLTVVKDLIEAGQIGRLLELRCRGKEDPRRGGAEDLWVLGSHVINLMHQIGGEPQWCFATVREAGHSIGPSDVKPGNEGLGALAGDHVQAVYGMANEVHGYFNSVRGAGASASRFGLRILGTEGVIAMSTGYPPTVRFLPDPQWSSDPRGTSWHPISSAGLDQPEPIKEPGLGAGNIAACLDLIDAIENDRLPLCNVYEGRTTVEMITAVFESQRTGGPVPFPLKNRQNPLEML